MTENPTKRLDVGYARPPVENRFSATNQPKGRRGRKRGSRNLRTLIERELDTKVTVPGARHKRTKRELLAMNMVNRAVTKGGRDAENMYAIICEMEAAGEVGRPASLSAAQKTILEGFKARLHREIKAKMAAEPE